MKSTLTNNGIPFTQIPNVLIDDTNLSALAKIVYCHIASKPNGWNFAIIRIAKFMKEGKSAVNRAVIELEQAGYLKRTPIKKNNIYVGNNYEIFRDPKPTKQPELFDDQDRDLNTGCVESNSTDRPSTGIKSTGHKSTDQAVRYSNTKESNTIGTNKENNNNDKDDFEKNSKSSLHKILIKNFFDWHLKEKKFEYQFCGGKDGAAVKNLIQKMKRLYEARNSRAATDQEIVNAFEWILQTIKKMQDPWIFDNVSPALINSKFNNIIDHGKNGHSKTRKFQTVSEYFREQGIESILDT